MLEAEEAAQAEKEAELALLQTVLAKVCPVSSCGSGLSLHDQRKMSEPPASEPASKRIKTEHKAPQAAVGSSTDSAIDLSADSDSEDEFEPKRAPERKEAAGDGKHGTCMCGCTFPTLSFADDPATAQDQLSASGLRVRPSLNRVSLADTGDATGGGPTS
jgi:hypothetical protein